MTATLNNSVRKFPHVEEARHTVTKKHRQQGKNRKVASIAARARQRNKQERLGIPVAADPATRFAVAKHKRSKND